ncbi:MAG TPA: type III-A CRISPR-associated protein Csm2 [Candidatus Obscuribacterales bacterium]
MPIDKDIENHIKSDKLKSLKDYSIRELVKHAQEFGPYLKEQKLQTNQIRKFLDAINRLKVKIAQNADQSTQNSEQNNKTVFSKIEPEVVLLKPKLAYAAARQPAAKPLSKVISVAIDKVHSIEDFERLVQFIESTIAYHKAEGGQ